MKCARRINAAEGQNGRHAVIEKKPCEKIGTHIAIVLQAAHRTGHRPHALPHGSEKRQALAWLIRRKEEQGNAEEQEPQSRDRAGQPLRLVRGLINTE